MGFRNDIQGLRALAFLFVFFFHLKPEWLKGGYIGVDMFFVISGYLISSIILHQVQNSKFSIKSFYEKRIKRIVPAYFSMLILVSVVGYFVYLPSDAGTLRGTLFRSALFISNMLFANGESYFGAQSHENPLLHTWSLAIEMQFYLFLPLIFIVLNRNTLPYVIAILTVCLVGYSSWEIYFNQAKTSMYFSLLARIPEFFIGTLFSFVSSRNIKFSKALGTTICLIGLIGLIASAFVLTADSNFPGVLSLIPSISTGLLLICTDNLVSSFFSSKPMVQIGEWSYSLYLWHWPIMAFMRYKMIDFGLLESIFIIIITFVLSYLSYSFIENKFRKFDNRRFIKFFSPIIAAMVVFAYFLPVYANTKKLDSLYVQPSFGMRSHHKPFVETLGSDNKSSSVNKRILLIGNSHALMTKPFLNYIGEKKGFSFNTITTSAYPAIKGIDRNEVPIKDYKSFETSLSLIPLTEEEIINNDIVIFNMHNFCSIPSIKFAMIELIESLRPNQKLILLKTFPILDTDPLRVNYNIKKIGDYDFGIINNSCSRKLIDELVDSYDNVYSFDLQKSKVFDTPAFYMDTLAYYDQGHINTYASIEMGKDLYFDFSNFLLSIVSLD